MRTLKTITAIAFTGVITLLMSCAKEDTPKPSTGPGGTVDARDKFSYSWTCNENSKQFGIHSYAIVISKSTTNSNQLFIDNFYNGSTNKAVVDVSNNNLLINSQTIAGSNVAGSGTYISASQVNLIYTVYDGTTTDSCTATLSSPH